MSEFGYSERVMNGAVISSWESGPFTITKDGKSWTFEDSDRFGPHILKKTGDISDRQPGESSPFWRAHSLWVNQGRRLENDGASCVWHEPKPTIVRIVGRKIITLSLGEHLGLTVTESGSVLDFGE